MSNKKSAAKSSTKTEPAAKKATASPAPKKTVVKKTVKETAPPAPVRDVELQTRLEELEQSNAELKSEYVELANRNEKLQQDLATKKTNATTAKLETSRVKTLLDENIAYAAKLEKKVEALTNEALTNTRGWINRGNKWVFAAVPVLILSIWLFFVYQDRNHVREAYAAHLQKDAIKKQRQDSAAAATQKSLDSARTILDSYGRPDTTLAGKKKPRN